MSIKTETTLAFEVLETGVAIRVAPSDLADRVRESFPQGALERDARVGDAEFSIDLTGPEPPEAAVERLDEQIREHLARHAPNHVFVNAEILTVGGRAIVIPGDAGGGQSALAAALVRSGCEQFATGQIPLRTAGTFHTHTTNPPREDLGPRSRDDHAHVAIIAAIAPAEAGFEASYAEAPRTRGAEVLLEHTVALDERRELAETAAESVSKQAVTIEGRHDGADSAVAFIMVRLAGGPRETAQAEPPPAIRFVTFVFELETQLSELAPHLESAEIDAVLLNGPELLPAFVSGFADSTPAVLSIPHEQIPRALGVLQETGWTQTPGERDPRFFRNGVVISVKGRPRVIGRLLGRDPGPTAKGRLGFPEPVGNAEMEAPARQATPIDPGGPLRTGLFGAMTQTASEALTVLDTLRARTREREFNGVPIQYGPGVFGFETVTEKHLASILAHLPGDGSGTRFVEIGTATGAVAFAVARERPATEVFATDVSLRALGWARRNRRRLGLSRVALAQGSLFAPIPEAWRGTVTVVAANPPLAPPARNVELSGASGWPAGTATGPGADGLGLVRGVARDAWDALAPGGYLHLQVQGPQAPLLVPYLDELGYDHNVTPEGPHGPTVEVAARKPHS